ncbi:MAG: helix-turn-helix transcriptional regulator [Bacilli bacterium]|nr:helix-turn-helix transcriptional regulator [Bacilli bacterium]
MGKTTRRNDDSYEIIAKNIKTCRKKAGLTQAELADLAGFSHEFIRRIEAPHAKKYFSVDTVVRLARALDVKMEEIFGGIDTTNLSDKIENDE